MLAIVGAALPMASWRWVGLTRVLQSASRPWRRAAPVVTACCHRRRNEAARSTPSGILMRRKICSLPDFRKAGGSSPPEPACGDSMLPVALSSHITPDTEDNASDADAINFIPGAAHRGPHDRSQPEAPPHTLGVHAGNVRYHDMDLSLPTRIPARNNDQSPKSPAMGTAPRRIRVKNKPLQRPKFEIIYSLAGTAVHIPAHQYHSCSTPPGAALAETAAVRTAAVKTVALAKVLGVRPEAVRLVGKNFLLDPLELAKWIEDSEKAERKGLHDTYMQELANARGAGTPCFRDDECTSCGLSLGPGPRKLEADDFGTSTWVAPGNDPQNILQKISNELLAWSPGGYFCEVCWCTGAYLYMPLARNRWRRLYALCSSAGIPAPPPDKWSDLLVKAYELNDLKQEEADLKLRVARNSYRMIAETYEQRLLEAETTIALPAPRCGAHQPAAAACSCDRTF